MVVVLFRRTWVSTDGINAHVQIVHEKYDVFNIVVGNEKYNNANTNNHVISNKEIPYKNGIEAHTKFPSDKKLDDVLKKIPAMPKAEAPVIPPIKG